MRIAASATGPRILLSFCNTSRGRWTIGIRPSPTLSRPDETSSWSRARASDAQPARSPRRFREWRRMPLVFLDALGLERVDLLGFSLGGMVAQGIALARPSLVRRMLLVGTAPEGGEESCTCLSRCSAARVLSMEWQHGSSAACFPHCGRSLPLHC